MNVKTTKVCFIRKPSSIGGPSSFQTRFQIKLKENGYNIYYFEKKICDKSTVIFVIGGTKKIFWLLKNKFYGIPIILRLDGINDYSYHFKNGLKNFLKSRLINLIVNFTRLYIADHVVYQSLYVKKVWKNLGGANIKSSIIYNAVDLREFTPSNKKFNYKKAKIVVVEGTIQGELATNAIKAIPDFQLDLYGLIDKNVKENITNSKLTNFTLHGAVPRKNIPKVFKGKKIYLSLEINPACPNSVIEALASGVPVVGFNSGSLKELVGDAGIILPYTGGNPRKVEAPNCKNLNKVLIEINNNYEKYSLLARSRAEKLFNLNDQYTKYISLFKI
jgi:glycosyltransferase involved in cell wall biosynthesis